MTIDDLARLLPLMAEHGIERVRVGDCEVTRGASALLTRLEAEKRLRELEKGGALTPEQVASFRTEPAPRLPHLNVTGAPPPIPPIDEDALSPEDQAEVDAYKKWQRGTHAEPVSHG